MQPSSTQVAMAAALVATISYGLLVGDTDRWRQRLQARFVYGVPWGTLVTVGGVVAFYLFGQSGLQYWENPVIYPFISWSYFYPLGMLTAGFAHAGPAHLVGNMTATLVFAPIAEFAWGHYPPSDRPGEDAGTVTGGGSGGPTGQRATGETATGHTATGETAIGNTATGRRGTGHTASGGTGTEHSSNGPPTSESLAETFGTENRGGPPSSGIGPTDSTDFWQRPWARALVVVPGAMIVMSLLTSFLALGWSLGFSGTVFAIAGFALLLYPIRTTVSMFVFSVLLTLFDAFMEPVIRTTTDAGAPGPPGWAGINVQAHGLGFIFGVLLALVLLWHRRQRVNVERVFLATLLFVFVRGLWALSWSEDDVYFLYQGVGVVVVLGLTILVTAAVDHTDRSAPNPLSRLPATPRAQHLAYLWLVIVGGLSTLTLAVLVTDSEYGVAEPIFLVFFAVVFALPAVPGALQDTYEVRWPIRRQTAAMALVSVALLVALPSLIGNIAVIGGGDVVPGSGEVEVRGYHLTYEENATDPRSSGVAALPMDDWGNSSGVLVIHEDRELFTPGVRKAQLAHDGEGTVRVGGLGWSETVHANRTGWLVTGNETAYAVDLTVDDETTRSFTTDPVRAHVKIDDRQVWITAREDGFAVDLRGNGTAGEASDSAPIPAMNETASLGPVEVETEPVDGTATVFVATEDTRVQVAERETYD